MLEGNNTITGVANASLTTFHGFMQNCTFCGSGNLQMNMSANAAVSNGVFAFGYRYGTTEAVTLDPSFTGWVSASCSNVGNNPASVFERANDELRLPSTDGFFITKGNTLPAVAQTPATTNTNLNVAHVNFGKADGSPQATLRLINSDTFLGTNYVGKELSATIGCALQAMGGQAPFYYTAANLPGGLSINPETGVISGTYTTPNKSPEPKVIFTVTDLQGRQTTMSINQPWVYGKMTTDNTSLANLDWTRNVAIKSIDLSSLIANGAGPYTFTVLDPNSILGNTRLPAGVLLSSDGVISGTPTRGGNFKTAIQVTDAIGQVAGFVLEGHISANYEFKVAGTLVTSSNMDNIPVNGKTEGTISYDPETETLTFDHVQITNNGHVSTTYFVDSKISKIKVIGDNKIIYLGTVSGASEYLGFPGSLEIYGVGAFSFRSGGSANTNSYAVNGDVTIMDDATILLGSYKAAINGTLTIPMDQAIYTSSSTKSPNLINDWGRLNSVAEPVNNPAYKTIKTERLENGALRFAEDFHLPDFLISIPMRINLADYVAGGVAPYSYNVTGLPSGIQSKNNGLIWGTPNPTTEAVSNVTITVTDAMGRSITMTERLTVVHPDINYHIYGGNASEVSGGAHDWYEIENMDLGGYNRLMYVDFPWDTNQDLNTNVIARDENGNWWAKDIELTDGVPYVAPHEVNAENISYTRTFANAQIDNWQSIYVPFAIDVEKYKDDFDIAEIFTVSPIKDTNKDGKIDGSDELFTVISRLNTGKTIPNLPYVIRPKKSGDQIISIENSSLKAAENGTIEFSTSRTSYTITGIYETTTLYPGDNNFYVTSTGGLSYRSTSPGDLKPNKWYMHAESRGYGEHAGNSSISQIKEMRFVVIGEEIDEVTAIKAASGELCVKDIIFTINGMKIESLDHAPAGIYIKNGKKIIKK